MMAPQEPAWFDRVQAIFTGALRLGDLAQRQEYLTRECAGDLMLRREVEELLRSHGDAPAWLDTTGMPAATRENRSLPASIGGHRILREIGRGGMGVVYAAEQPHPKREVALKIVNSGLVDAHARRRFATEIELAGRLVHPGIARVLAAGEHTVGVGPPMPFFTMELVAGPPITTFAEERELDVAGRCNLLAQVCDAVQYAHDAGVIHRDLKPANVLVVAASDGVLQPKLLDFGIAHAIGDDPSNTSLLTRTGQLIGTLEYMSPEQCATTSRTQPDVRSDVYALGVILYELLAHRRPLELDGAPLWDAVRRIRDEEPTRLAHRQASMRGDLDTIVSTAMAKDRDRRYPSAKALADDLRRFLSHQPIAAQAPTFVYRLRKFVRRNRAFVAATATVLCALLVALLVSIVFAVDADRARHDAINTREAMRANLYRAQMVQAGQALLQAGAKAPIRRTLADWLPTPGTRDLRGFEWQLLAACTEGRSTAWFFGGVPIYLAWSDDDRTLLVGDFERARLVDANTGQAHETLTAAGGLLQSTLDPTGRWLAVSGSSAEVRVCALAESDRVFTVRTPCVFERLFLSAGGRLLMFGGSDKLLHVFEVATGKSLLTVDRASEHSAHAITTDERRIARAVQERIDVIDVASGRVVGSLVGHTTVVRDIAFSGDGTRLASLAYDSTLRVWDLSTWACTHTFPQPQRLNRLAWSPDDQRIAACGNDRRVIVCDPRTGMQTTVGEHAAHATAVAWDHQGQRLASAGQDGRVQIWDLSHLPAVRRTRAWSGTDADRMHDVRWNADGSNVQAATQMASVVWNTVPNSRPEATPRGRPRTSSDGRWQAGVDARFWVKGPADAHTQDLTIRPSQGEVEWLPGSARALLSTGTELLVFDAEANTSRRVLDGWVAAMACTPDGSTVAVALMEMNVALLDLATGATTPVLSRPYGIHAMTWDPLGQRLAIGDADAITLWTRSGHEKVLRGHHLLVRGLAWHPDGSRLASASEDDSVRFWDPDAGAQCGMLEFESRPCAVRWSPDGKQLAVLLADGDLVVFDTRDGNTLTGTPPDEPR